MIAARPDAPRNLVQALEFLGPPDAQGRRRVQYRRHAVIARWRLAPLAARDLLLGSEVTIGRVDQLLLLAIDRAIQRRRSDASCSSNESTAAGSNFAALCSRILSR